MSGWTEYVCILGEHQGVVLQHGGWAGGWECTIENWHITKCHGESRVIWVVKRMEKHECLSIIILNSVQGNKKIGWKFTEYDQEASQYV